MDTVRLLARADDAGLNETANRAIRSTAVQGIVRNISLMAPAPAIGDAAEVLGDLGERVDFGLHVTLTAEWENLRWGPLLPPGQLPSISRADGTFHYTVDELASAGPDPDELTSEVEAQLDRLTALGFSIGYLDEHMNVGAVEGLSAALADFCRRKGLVSHRDLLDSGSLHALDGWPGPGEHPGTELADHLSSLESGTYYLVGHPVFKTEEIEALRHRGEAPGLQVIPRNRQRRMFADIEIVDYCENRGIELIRYRSL